MASIAGASIARLSVISATMSITARGARAVLPKSAIMATMTNGDGSDGTPGATGSRSRQMPAPSSAPMNMPGPKMPPDPPEPMESEVAENLGEGQRQDHPQRKAEQGVTVETRLDPAVAGAEDAGQRERQATHGDARDGRPQLAGQGPGLEPARHAVETGDVEPADDAAGESDQRVVDELARIGEAGAAGTTEDRAEADDRAEDRERHDRADEGRHQGVRFHVVAIRDLDRKNRATQRRSKDRPDPGAHARTHRDSGVPGVEVEDSGQE